MQTRFVVLSALHFGLVAIDYGEWRTRNVYIFGGCGQQHGIRLKYTYTQNMCELIIYKMFWFTRNAAKQPH